MTGRDHVVVVIGVIPRGLAVKCGATYGVGFLFDLRYLGER